MSQELHVFMKRERMPTPHSWQSAIDVLGIPLVLDPKLDLEHDTGFLPCTLNGEATGFEIYPGDDAKELISAYPQLPSLVGDRSNVISFRWSDDLKECGCVLAAAAALVQSFAAVAYDPQEDAVHEFSRLLDDARQCL